MVPANILWSDSSCYAARFEKSAAALAAIGQALAQNPIAKAVGFSVLLEPLFEAEAEHFTRLWNDPTAYFWVRRAVHFLAACNGAPMGRIEAAYCAEVGVDGPAQALHLHLEDFKRFALALAIITRNEIAFDQPFRATLPLALPGTDLVISGSGDIAIQGATTAHVQATYHGEDIAMPVANDATSTSSSKPHLARCQLIEIGDVRCALNPALFRLPGIGLDREWTTPDADFQSLHATALRDALSLVASLQPETFALMRYGLRAVALKPMREGAFSSLSSSELPGAFICSVPCDRFELAATLIHEFFHNRLFCIEESGAFFEAGIEDPIEGEYHYSPWRDGPRPLHGLFHALYVYLPVFRFWDAALNANRLEGDQIAYAIDQLARIPVQLRIGVNQLKRHAQFTSFGAMLFEQMATETAGIEARVRALGISLHAPAFSLRTNGCFLPVLEGRNGRPLSVGETLHNHLANRDLRGECRAEKLSLERALASKTQE